MIRKPAFEDSKNSKQNIHKNCVPGVPVFLHPSILVETQAPLVGSPAELASLLSM